VGTIYIENFFPEGGAVGITGGEKEKKEWSVATSLRLLRFVLAVPFAVVGLGMEARRVKTCVCMHGLIHDSPPEAFVVAEEPQKGFLSDLLQGQEDNTNQTTTPLPPYSGVSLDSLEA